jgi:hypothetical protein
MRNKRFTEHLVPFHSGHERSLHFVGRPGHGHHSRGHGDGDASPSACNGPFTRFACNDDSGLLRSAISTNLTANITYYVVVWVGPVTDVSATPLNIQLRVTRPVAPTNNVCSQAEVIPTDATLPYSTLVTDTTLADETGDPPSSCAFGARSVWYQFSPPSAGIYIFSTGADTVTTVDDTAMTIYRNNGGCGGTFTEVVCSDNGFGRALVSASLTNGQTYYIVIWDETFESLSPAPSGYIAGETSIQLRVSRATAPTIVTLGASSIASTGAVLTASINPNGAQSRYWFEWEPRRVMATRPRSGAAFRHGEHHELDSDRRLSSQHHHSLPRGGDEFRRPVERDRSDISLFQHPSATAWRQRDHVPGGSYYFTFSGSPAHLYVVQASANLVTWTNLGPATESTTPGQFRSPQIGTPVLPQRFSE